MYSNTRNNFTVDELLGMISPPAPYILPKIWGNSIYNIATKSRKIGGGIVKSNNEILEKGIAMGLTMGPAVIYSNKDLTPGPEVFGRREDILKEGTIHVKDVENYQQYLIGAYNTGKSYVPSFQTITPEQKLNIESNSEFIKDASLEKGASIKNVGVFHDDFTFIHNEFYQKLKREGNKNINQRLNFIGYDIPKNVLDAINPENLFGRPELVKNEVKRVADTLNTKVYIPGRSPPHVEITIKKDIEQINKSNISPDVNQMINSIETSIGKIEKTKEDMQQLPEGRQKDALRRQYEDQSKSLQNKYKKLQEKRKMPQNVYTTTTTTTTTTGSTTIATPPLISYQTQVLTLPTGLDNMSYNELIHEIDKYDKIFKTNSDSILVITEEIKKNKNDQDLKDLKNEKESENKRISNFLSDARTILNINSISDIPESLSISSIPPENINPSLETMEKKEENILKHDPKNNEELLEMLKKINDLVYTETHHTSSNTFEDMQNKNIIIKESTTDLEKLKKLSNDYNVNDTDNDLKSKISEYFEKINESKINIERFFMFTKFNIHSDSFKEAIIEKKEILKEIQSSNLSNEDKEIINKSDLYSDAQNIYKTRDHDTYKINISDINIHLSEEGKKSLVKLLEINNKMKREYRDGQLEQDIYNVNIQQKNISSLSKGLSDLKGYITFADEYIKYNEEIIEALNNSKKMDKLLERESNKSILKQKIVLPSGLEITTNEQEEILKLNIPEALNNITYNDILRVDIDDALKQSYDNLTEKERILLKIIDIELLYNNTPRDYMAKFDNILKNIPSVFTKEEFEDLKKNKDLKKYLPFFKSSYFDKYILETPYYIVDKKEEGIKKESEKKNIEIVKNKVQFNADKRQTNKITSSLDTNKKSAYSKYSKYLKLLEAK